jgi:hypothetical protein
MPAPEEPKQRLHISADDPRVPRVLRESAARFGEPGWGRVTVRPGGCKLLAMDGGLLDMLACSPLL